MYIFFNDNGDEFLRYFDDEIPKGLKKSKYMNINKKDIPIKERCITRAKLVDGKIKWVFNKVEQPIDAEEEINQLKEENEMLELALMEMALANEEITEETELAIAELTNLIGGVL